MKQHVWQQKELTVVEDKLSRETKNEKEGVKLLTFSSYAFDFIYSLFLYGSSFKLSLYLPVEIGQNFAKSSIDKKFIY